MRNFNLSSEAFICILPDVHTTCNSDFNILKGNSHGKKVVYLMVESDRPSKWWIFAKKIRSKFSLFRELFRFEFSIFDLCDVTQVKFHPRAPFKYWKLYKRRPRNFLNNWNGSIEFDISNIFGMRIPKIVFIFEINDAFIN